MKPLQSKMSFDVLQRYRLAAELINVVRGEKPLNILDAGSRIGYLRSFLPDDFIVNLDISYFPAYSRLVGDVLRLPFSSETFDFPLSLDVLEHVEPSSRREFFNEMARVSRDFFLIGAPFKGEEVEKAEKLVNEFFLNITGVENQFLTEHIHFGLPDLGEVMEWVKECKYQAVVFQNNYLPRWMMMMCFNAYLSHLPRSGELAIAINSLYDHQFSKFDNQSPAYRQIIIISKSGNLQEDIIRRQFAVPELPPDFYRQTWDFVNRFLSKLALHHERVLLKVQEENNELQNEKTELQNEKYEIQRQLEVEKDRFFRTRLELEGIKGTFAYKLYRKTIGRTFDRTNPPNP